MRKDSRMDERNGNPCWRCKYLLRHRGHAYFWCPGPHKWTEGGEDQRETLVRYEKDGVFGRVNQFLWRRMFLAGLESKGPIARGYALALRKAIEAGYVKKDKMDAIISEES